MGLRQPLEEGVYVTAEGGALLTHTIVAWHQPTAQALPAARHHLPLMLLLGLCPADSHLIHDQSDPGMH
jgi:hypothetical protein